MICICAKRNTYSAIYFTLKSKSLMAKKRENLSYIEKAISYTTYI